MRVGGFLSVAFHVAAVAAGMIVAPALKSDPTPMIMIPLELVTISDTTNIAPVSEKAKQDDKAQETNQPEAPQPAAAPPPPKPEEFVPDAATPPPKKEADKKADAKDAKPDPDAFKKSLSGILSQVDTKQSKNQRSAASDKAANLRNVPDAAPRMGAGDMKRMTATVGDAIRSQLISNGCWTDHSDMADAQRLTVTLRVSFTRDGHFEREPQLIGREPSGDPPLQVFLQLARNGLSKCNNIGFRVPPEYFQAQPVVPIDLVMIPKAAAMQ